MIQFLRGTTAENDAYTGAVASLTIDLDNNEIRLHDGVTAGGTVVGKVDTAGNITSISATSPLVLGGTTEEPVISIQSATQSRDGFLSSSDKTKIDGLPSVASFNISQWDDSYSWGDHAIAGYLKSVAVADVNGLSSALADKAPIDNPTFTGVVTIDEGTL